MTTLPGAVVEFISTVDAGLLQEDLNLIHSALNKLRSRIEYSHGEYFLIDRDPQLEKTAPKGMGTII